LLCHGMS